MACHLLKACDYWTDTGEGTFSLYYLRNKEKEEIDFLVTCDRRPWLLCEAKLSDARMRGRTRSGRERRGSAGLSRIARQPLSALAIVLVDPDLMNWSS